MAQAFALNERLLSTGIGPAGTGKTTAQTLVTAAVTDAGAQVIALAPQAAAVKVLSDELSAHSRTPVKAETIDSFVGAYQSGSGEEKYPVKAGDLILVDEAGMASTPLLAGVIAVAEEHGARVAFLGDDAQLAAVGAGGALRLLAQQTETVNLEDLHRFRHPDGTINEAEAAATLALREPPTHGGRDEPFTYYQDKGALVGGTGDTMREAAYIAWQKDINTGLDSIMMAYDNATVTGLNARAQAYRAMNGDLDTTHGTELADGLVGHVGDRIVTRSNHRRLVFNKGKDFVRNGASWTITGHTEGGGIKAKHLTSGGTITLPAKYVRESVQLGYAATIHRTQGVTADTAHAVFTSAMTRSLAYVAASRGKYSNKIYTALSEGERLKDVLSGIAENYERNITAHEAAAQARAAHRSLPERVAAYNDLHAEATTRRYAAAAKKLLGPDANELTQDKGFPAIAQALAKAAAQGINTDTLIKAAAGPILADLAKSKPTQKTGLVKVVDAAKAALAPHQKTAPKEAVIEDPVGLLRSRVKAITRRWVTDRETITPLGNVSDGHLRKLADLASLRSQDTDTAKAATTKALAKDEEKARTRQANAGKDTRWVKRAWHTMEGTHWSMRMHGHLGDAELTTRLQNALMKSDQAPQNSDGRQTRDKQSWVARTLLEEKALRARMSPEHRAVEDHERGPGTISAKYGDMASRAGFNYLNHANITIEKRITAEQIRRQRYTTPETQHKDTAQHKDGVQHKDGTPPEWLTPHPSVEKTNPAWSMELATRYEGIREELTRRGTEIAVNQPEWAKHLGPVPGAHTTHDGQLLPGGLEPQNRWLTLAASIDTYRLLHNVPAHETEPIPTKHRSAEADQIRAEIVSLHKYTEQTTTPAASPEELTTRNDTEELTTRVKETPAAAENTIHEHLRDRYHGTEQETSVQNPQQTETTRPAPVMAELPEHQKHEYALAEHARKIRETAQHLQESIQKYLPRDEKGKLYPPYDQPLSEAAPLPAGTAPAPPPTTTRTDMPTNEQLAQQQRTAAQQAQQAQRAAAQQAAQLEMQRRAQQQRTAAEQAQQARNLDAGREL